MRAIQGIGNWVLVLMAASSLIAMIAAFQVDMIVNQDLYSHGLQFSHDWAIPYWDSIRIIFAMAWLNIIAAITFQIYRIRTIRKTEEQEETEALVEAKTPLELQLEAPEEQEESQVAIR
jgi:hypothetical protein